MGCCGGGKVVGRCCLCSRAVRTDSTPWGSKRKICSYCKEKQLNLVKERERMNLRAKTLMEGKDFK